MSPPQRHLKPSALSNIAAALKTERATIGLTQKEVAQQLKISLKALRNLEQGHGGVTLETAARILRLLGKELRVGDIIVPVRKIPSKRPRRDSILETLRLVKPVMRAKFGVREIYLFGSCARDEAKKTSDIDLALEFENTPSFSDLGKLSAFLEALADGNKIDLVELNKLTPDVARAARKDFIRV